MQVNSQQPEAVFSLSAQVRERFMETTAGLSDAELQQHQKVVAFRESVKSSFNQGEAWRRGDACVCRQV